MTRILALDTTASICSAALYIDGCITAEQREEPRRHTELLLPMVDRLLAGAELSLSALDAIAFGRGPGSFTGLRIALGVAQGMAFACDLPLLAISSLATMAQGAADVGAGAHFCCALDARMGEVYWGEFRLAEDGVVVAQGEECVASPDAVPLPDTSGWLALGSGWGVAGMPAAIQPRLDCDPVARAMLPLALRDWQAGNGIHAESAAPVYLRNRVAVPIDER